MTTQRERRPHASRDDSAERARRPPHADDAASTEEEHREGLRNESPDPEPEGDVDFGVDR